VEVRRAGLVVICMFHCSQHTSASVDAGPDDCVVDTDCQTGHICAFSTLDGCFAPRRKCLPGSRTCKAALPACACSDHDLMLCGDGTADVPVKNLGTCTSACGGANQVCCSGLSCEVCNTTSYSPPAVLPADVEANACTQSEIGTYVDACFSQSSTTAKCFAWNADAGACGACLSHPRATYACYELLFGQACAEAVAARDGCIDFACGTCAPESLAACTSAARAAECESYSDLVDSPTGPCPRADAGRSTCEPANIFDHFAFANLFCGTGS
jgi:hypothetical protein